MPAREELPVRVNHPRRLPAWSLPAQRIAIGKGYKPTMALLPDGSLVMLALYMKHGLPEGGRDAIPANVWWNLDESLPVGKCREYSCLWRSTDGGTTWTGGDEVPGLIAREHWLTCTSNGTLFTSSHLLSFDVNSDFDHTTSWIHRSTDGGKTWERQQADVESDLRCGTPVANGAHTSRNVVELSDGTLLLGVSINSSSVAYMWRSTDNGVTWDKTQRARIGGYYGNFNGFFCEDYTYLNDSEELLHWCRMSPLDYTEGSQRSQGQFPIGDQRVVPTGNDGINRLMMTTSADYGRSWTPLVDAGDYGQMYPRVTKLRDGRLLMTYTQRALLYPTGLRARLSCDDGRTWDFDHDQIVIEGFTPWGAEQGGGFGNTLQLADGSLVSCYSWNPGDDKYETEVARWQLP